jgi:chemotaxis signal transduction protein
VARQDLAMEAACIRGILPLTDLEPAAAGRSGLLGFTSLKGQMVGVIDLRTRLGLDHTGQGSQPKIVVLELASGTRQHLLGWRIEFPTWWCIAIVICGAAHCAAKDGPAN